ncbi:unnamed protein product [Rotaria sordida]|uniref:Uncharacterized protein n=1 Tax=Rotaria sordida TaxID=392033 RepID=A0A816ERB9_9BILA|nr:unnamed protein product [Rotaria sordida]CAF1285123.1 unnamed protein product [Rotaria sordida]CAF1486358.1 unnamed protein product [Rotaria sordida]CAF1649978.1 unnamed protein product [Rotaria sordida]
MNSMISMLRYNFIILELIALILASIAISTCSWEKVILKDYEAVQAIYQSPLLTALTTYDNIKINYENATGYILKIKSGLIDICTYLRQPNHKSFGSGHCKQIIARPSIGLAIIGIICLVIGIVCFADEENCNNREAIWLFYCSAIFTGLGGLFLFTSHWTYSISSELQLPTIYIRYGFSTYLIVISAIISLLSMSLVLWRMYLRRVYGNHQSKMNSTKRHVYRKISNRHL